MNMNLQEYDRRRRRTRQALLSAFGELATERRFDEIRVADIIDRAEVARSTFYEHYRNKSELLAEATSGLFGVMADAVWKTDRGALEYILAHFWENRRLAAALLTGAPARSLNRMLSEAIEERMGRHLAVKPASARRLIAVQIAGGQLALLRSWLNGETVCTVGDLAGTISRTSSAAAGHGGWNT